MKRCAASPLARVPISLGIGLLLLLGLQPGCKRSVTVVGPKGERVRTTAGDDVEVDFRNGDGEEVRFAGGKKAVALPANFPADVPIYQNATVVMTTIGEKETRAMLTTTDSLKKVKEFYGKELKKRDWAPATTTDVSKMSMLEYKKGNRGLVVLVVGDDADRTSIQISVSKKK